jgi:hypothetical protein
VGGHAFLLSRGKRHPDGPFATLIRVATTYLHPEADDLESLQRLAKREDRPEMRAFKAGLRQAITHPGQLPGAELSSHVQYDDGSPEKFLRRLWRDLYGDEPPRNRARDVLHMCYFSIVRIGVYIDGFSLYYGARGLCGRGTPGWRWLDLRALAADLAGRRSGDLKAHQLPDPVGQYSRPVGW